MNRETPARSAASLGPFASAARGQGGGRPPVWIMRQAGRYLPQYQAVRARHSFVDMCVEPDIAVDVSLQPYREFGFDAVVVFYDILFILEALGAPLAFTERGPVFARPITCRADVDSLRSFEASQVEWRIARNGTGRAPVLETIRRLRAELPREVAVLGFAGAPFTLAAYVVEGDFRRSGERIRRFFHEDPAAVEALLESITRVTEVYIADQIDAGADAVQLFDTWVGLLGGEDFDRFAAPYLRRIFAVAAARDVPSILYVNGGSHLLDRLAATGAGVLSIDWRTELADARRRLGPRPGLQGNLDPTALFAAPDLVRGRVQRILESMRGDPAYIFNLGHGILPETPVASVRALVEAVRAFDPMAGHARSGA
jgi:uroporphyrinogen decarboxylase